MNDRYSYWEGIDKKFIDRLVPEHVFYADGHMSIETSNHRDMWQFYCSARLTIASFPSTFKEAALRYADGVMSMFVGQWISTVVEANCSIALGASTLDTEPNVTGFNTRMGQGEIGGNAFVNQLRQISFSPSDTLDIVCHSMGFAYALGMVKSIKAAYPTLKFGSFYIIAPENAESGEVTLSDWQEVWQYGSNEEELKNKTWLQDGVAPQSPVKNIGIYRATIPTDGSVPQGFISSHSIGNYKWIFTKQTIGRPGYVKPRE